jgi:predicted cupin superfamily sugar epimerase
MRYLIAACVVASAMPMTSSSSPSQGVCAQDVIDKLDLKPHPEKGYYKETFQDPGTIAGSRSYSSAIYYFLEGKVGHAYWHRVDAAEVWYVPPSPEEPHHHNTKTGTTMPAHL